MNDVEPYIYLRDVLTRMVDGHPTNRLDALLPWTWKTENPVNGWGQVQAPDGYLSALCYALTLPHLAATASTDPRGTKKSTARHVSKPSIPASRLSIDWRKF
ncbi:transposase domain-containing protein [Bradyrhizobium sp. SZCCHNR3013]|uniref:transposase domain-containing protein n=1 Tax=unclassified Bradyrhizobium TaxID=2631580 RepID=UPI003966DD4D